VAQEGRLTPAVAAAGFALLDAVRAQNTEAQAVLALQSVLELIGDALAAQGAPPTLRLVERLCRASQEDCAAMLREAFDVGTCTREAFLADVDSFLESLDEGQAAFTASMQSVLQSGTREQFQEAKAASEAREEARGKMSSLRDLARTL